MKENKTLQKVFISILAGLTSLILTTQINKKEEEMLPLEHHVTPIVMVQAQDLEEDDEKSDENEVEKEEQKSMLLEALKILLFIPFVWMIRVIFNAIKTVLLLIASPLLRFLLEWLIIFVLIYLLLYAIVKIFFPKVTLKQFFNWKNILFVAGLSLVICLIDFFNVIGKLIEKITKKQ